MIAFNFFYEQCDKSVTAGLLACGKVVQATGSSGTPEWIRTTDRPLRRREQLVFCVIFNPVKSFLKSLNSIDLTSFPQSCWIMLNHNFSYLFTQNSVTKVGQALASIFRLESWRFFDFGDIFRPIYLKSFAGRRHE